ncbi:MAG TPA: hypothetical protein VNI57_01475 [Candidatus Saccharimonadales bacterium]|nr:hypothetical protein [Candidatus Saccharimonadales bacterium]
MPTTTFSISVRVRGQEALAKMASRLRDFVEPFREIMKSWRAHNVEKFAQAEGMELAGVYFDDGQVYWDPVTAKYHTWKQRKGFPDWRMVLTGGTRDSLTSDTSPDWFERVEPLSAIFGSLNPLVGIHWDRSPVAFLDATDRASIEREVYDYLSGNPPYRPYPAGDTVSADAVSMIADAEEAAGG